MRSRFIARSFFQFSFLVKGANEKGARRRALSSPACVACPLQLTHVPRAGASALNMQQSTSTCTDALHAGFYDALCICTRRMPYKAWAHGMPPVDEPSTMEHVHVQASSQLTVGWGYYSAARLVRLHAFLGIRPCRSLL